MRTLPKLRGRNRLRAYRPLQWWVAGGILLLSAWLGLSFLGTSDTRRTAALALVEEAEGYFRQQTEDSYRQAIKKFDEAKVRWHSIGDDSEEAKILNREGEVYYWLGELPESLVCYQSALHLYQSKAEIKGQAESMEGIAVCKNELGDLKEADKYYEQALTLWKKCDDLQGIARTLNTWGVLQSQLGNKQKSFDLHQQALVHFQQIGDASGELSARNGIAWFYLSLGRVQEALNRYETSLKLAQAIGDKQIENTILRRIGNAYQSLGAIEKARSYYQCQLELSIVLGDQRQEAQAYENIGSTYNLDKAGKRSLDYYHKALLTHQKAKNLQGESSTLNLIGHLSESLGDKQQAFQCYWKALFLSQKGGYKAQQFTSNFNLARIEFSQNKFAQAQAYIEAAVTIGESLRAKVSSRDLRSSYFATVHQGFELYIDLLMKQQESNVLEPFAQEALTINERARARSLLDLLNDSHQNIKQGADPKLLEQERSLSQELNSKAERKMRLVGNKDKGQELATISQELEKLHSQIEEVRTRIRETSPHYAALTQPQPLKAPEIQQLLDDNTMLLEYTLGDERSYVWAVTKDSLEAFTLPKRAVIEQLSSEVYALMTAPQPQKDDTPQATLLRAKQADQQYWPKAAKLSQMLLAPMADKLGNKRLLIVSDGALQRIPFGALPAPAAFRVSSFEFRGQRHGSPTANRETRNSKLETNSLQPLIVEHEISYLPSASILSILRKERTPQQATPTRFAAMLDSVWGLFRQPPPTASATLDSVAILADPVFEKDDPRIQATLPGQTATSPAQTRDVDLSDENLHLNRLPETAVEAGEIERAAGAKAFLLKQGVAVNRALLEGDELNRYSIVHFATHGYWDSEHPGLSGLVLSRFDQQGNKQDGFLRLSDIYNLRMPKELVVLSACETALGKDIRGEGLMALTRGFMYAGASRVMASLWKVDEVSTVDLMKVFYGKLLREKLTPTAALRAAQIAMWRQDPTSAPYDWAAFVLQGEYR